MAGEGAERVGTTVEGEVGVDRVVSEGTGEIGVGPEGVRGWAVEGGRARNEAGRSEPHFKFHKFKFAHIQIFPPRIQIFPPGFKFQNSKREILAVLYLLITAIDCVLFPSLLLYYRYIYIYILAPNIYMNKINLLESNIYMNKINFTLQ